MASVFLGIAIMLHLASISAQPAPGCQTYCGDIKIPYPFGIGANCAIRSGFEINCNRTADGTEKPFIINVEVLEISLLHGQTRALNAISTYCYNHNTRSMYDNTFWLDFSLWPYRFSDVQNKFIVIGCNTLAYIYNSHNRTGYTTACASVCASPGAVTNGSCSGVGCCQNAIPKGLSRYDVYFDYVYNDSDIWQFNPCSYAVLVEAETFSFSSEYITTKRFNDTYKGQQPVVLDWVIGDETCEVARNMTSYACRSANSMCVDSTNGPGYICNCSRGYEGNPYLTDGCTDVNECETYPSPCPKTAVCHNTIGDYRCSCPPGRKLAKEANSCNPDITLIIGISVGVGLASAAGLIISILIGCCISKQAKQQRAHMLKRKFFEQNRGQLLQQLVSQRGDIAERMIIPLEELEKATHNFDEDHELGRGGHGTVYKGMLSDLHVVAIQKPMKVLQREIDEFINEVAILSQINHRNVVKLYGCCLETEVPMLVYEFISNGTLYEHLHIDEPRSLSWDDRLRIAIETAKSLAYLHSTASVPIIHRDVKSANILLDDTLTAKMADFGASRYIAVEKSGLTTMVQGTIGYLDPMYFYTGRLTEKSDVYSYGVMLIELLTRKKPFSYLSSEGEGLVAHFVTLFAQGNLSDILDPQVMDEGGKKIEEAITLAVACIQLKGEDRPTMRQVELTLEGLRPSKKHNLHGVGVNRLDNNGIRINSLSNTYGSSSKRSTRQYSMEAELIMSSRYPR